MTPDLPTPDELDTFQFVVAGRPRPPAETAAVPDRPAGRDDADEPVIVLRPPFPR